MRGEGALAPEESMAKLRDLLTQEMGTLQGLAILAGQERRALVDQDLADLWRIVDRTEELIGGLAELERKRSQCTASLRKQLAVEDARPTLRDLLAALPPAEAAELEQQRLELSQTLGQLREENGQNAALAGSALRVIQGTLDLLRRFQDAGSTYNPGGTTPLGADWARSLDRQA